jgi:hypothetical protein
MTWPNPWFSRITTNMWSTTGSEGVGDGVGVAVGVGDGVGVGVAVGPGVGVGVAVGDGLAAGVGVAVDARVEPTPPHPHIMSTPTVRMKQAVYPLDIARSFRLTKMRCNRVAAGWRAMARSQPQN